MYHDLRVMKKIKSEGKSLKKCQLDETFYLPVQEVFSEKVTFAKRLE